MSSNSQSKYLGFLASLARCNNFTAIWWRAAARKNLHPCADKIDLAASVLWAEVWDTKCSLSELTSSPPGCMHDGDWESFTFKTIAFAQCLVIEIWASLTCRVCVMAMAFASIKKWLLTLMCWKWTFRSTRQQEEIEQLNISPEAHHILTIYRVEFRVVHDRNLEYFWFKNQ